MIGKLEECINALMLEELARANKKHKLFSNCHEGYAVLLKEVEEAEEEFELIKRCLNVLWHYIKCDLDIVRIRDMSNEIKENTIRTIEELIQVGAMAQKMIDFCGKDDNNG